jgi:hypothetical protein
MTRLVRPAARAARIQQIRRNLVVDDFGCWMWQGPKRDGYGWLAGIGAHRLAYDLFVGPFPSGNLVIDHTCHDPETCICGDLCPHRACLNPAHMEPVTPYENWARGARGRAYFARLAA